MTDIRERHVPWPDVLDHCRLDDQIWPCDAIREADESDRLREAAKMLTAAWADDIKRADKAEAALARAYTLLVSVQPCVGRMVAKSPNAETLRLNRMLDAAIDVWVNDYLAAHEETTK